MGEKTTQKVLIKKDTKYFSKTTNEEHYTLVNEPTCVYRTCYCCNRRSEDHKRSNTQFFGTNNMQLNGITVMDGTNVNTGHKGGIIRLMELASIDHYNGEFVCSKQMNYLSVIY
ncbi:hypothetical protein AVEN_232356-1 [Araneus ventricosus]|uniref:Uncharacterized protein n=1 Tax=Araneus ventricosus TaxID=182803 RepID=A0A4Y1ZQX1_ARAVE|nr:hypothetical protein AVEN_232356-1 [Araneus ventricosus]